MFQARKREANQLALMMIAILLMLIQGFKPASGRPTI